MLKNLQKVMPKIGVLISTLIIGVAIFFVSLTHAVDDDETIRLKVRQGLVLANSAKRVVTEGFQSNSMTGVAQVSMDYTISYNTNASQYISEIIIGDDGVITINYNIAPEGIPQLSGGNTIVLTPSASYMGGTEMLMLAVGSIGNIHWACASASNVISIRHNLPSATGTMLSRYAPDECK